MGEHDGRYKHFFSYPRMVEDLLRGFFPEEWVSCLDLRTLERVSGSFTRADLRQRFGDMLWRAEVRRRGGWRSLYLLLEFQSAPERFMPVRLMGYVCGLLEDLIRERELSPGRSLPPIVPVVVYRGARPWRAPLDLQDLHPALPGSLAERLPRLRYRLLDLGRMTPIELEQPSNLAAAFFRIETRQGPEDLVAAAQVLRGALSPNEETGLWASFAKLLSKGFREAFPGGTIHGIEGLKEALMLEENMARWSRNFARKEQAKGMQFLLLRIMEERFGPVPSALRRKVRNMSSPRNLEDLAARVTKAASLEQLGLS